MKIFHVAKNGSDLNDGSQAFPLLTISKAAKMAQAGDTVIVHEGVYREWVKPEHSGRGEGQRIVFEAARGEKVVIKGSEVVRKWTRVEGSLWLALIDNSLFGEFNPFAQKLEGDWVVDPLDVPCHLGDVYLNGKSLYEAFSIDDVKNPVVRNEGASPPWSMKKEKILEPDRTVYQWFAEVSDEKTKIYANFQEVDPTKELVEISVRQCCFYPEKTGLDYITVRGFQMCHAATPWAPPTADQIGMVGPHWAKGWIIEGCVLHDAKCAAISLGKEASTGHNLSTRYHRKPGYQYQMEAVFRALKIGWSKEKIGSHIVRNNTIYDCGQNAIVGHLGCIFSKIYGNHIYNIAVKHEFFGYEIAGIKLHAAIDVEIRGNNIHNCTLGTWLDWQAQGTRVVQNLYYENDRDLMVEVSHGPYIVDNNIFASEYNFDNISQGGCYVHNLCCGTMRREQVLDRSVPYHLPHSTDVLGTALVFSGDDRIFQNIFVGGQKTYTPESKSGTSGYGEPLIDPLSAMSGKPALATGSGSSCLASFEEYVQKIIETGPGDHEVFMRVPQPAYINGNHYCNGAKPFPAEKECSVCDGTPKARVFTEGGKTYLEFFADESLFKTKTHLLNSREFESTRVSEAEFEDANGREIVFDTDFLGEKRGDKILPGPLQCLRLGANKVLLCQGA